MRFLLLLLLCTLPLSISAAPNVVVTIKPLHSFVAAVMGDTGTPTLLVSGSTSPHEFQLTPAQMKILQDADIVFFIDDTFETFLHNALETLPKSVHRVAMMDTDGLTLLQYRRGGAWEVHQHHEETHHHHHEQPSTIDPHLWLDPDNAVVMIQRIAEELSAVAPEYQATYAANAAALVKQITALDATIAGTLSDVKGESFIVFHDAYQYFERHYGLSGVGSITLDPTESPSPRRILDIRQKLRDTKARCVFREPYFSDKLVRTVTEGSTARTATLDPEATSLEAGAGLYIALLEQLSARMKECLQ